MPPLPPAPSCLRVQFQHTIAGINAYVHWYFQYTGTLTSATDAAAIANTLKSVYTTQLSPLCHPNVTLQAVQVTDLNSTSGGQGVSGSGGVVGTRTGGPLTANDCAMMLLRITRRYRGGKPRQYWPFGTDTDVLDPQHWTAGFVTAFNNGWTNFLTNALTTTWSSGQLSHAVNISYYTLPNKVVISPTTGRARNVPTLRSSPVIDIVASGVGSSRIATQRRRQHFSA